METVKNAINHLMARNFTGKQIDMAVEALEKQISKKPDVSIAKKDVKVGNLTFKEGSKIYKCQCDNWICYKDSYCRYCGQKLGWD